MATVTVTYHHEPEGWWAETEAIPRFSAAGTSYDEVHEQVARSLTALLNDPALDIREQLMDDLTGIVSPVTLVAAHSSPAPTIIVNHPMMVKALIDVTRTLARRLTQPASS